MPDLELDGTRLLPFTEEFVRPVFELIDRNRVHLSQNGDITANKYKSIQPLYESVMRPLNPLRERFVIVDGGSTVLGAINVEPEDVRETSYVLGYYLGAEFTGRGHARRAATLLSNSVLERAGVKEVCAYTRPINVPSQFVLLKSGFVYDALVKGDNRYVKHPQA